MCKLGVCDAHSQHRVYLRGYTRSSRVCDSCMDLERSIGLAPVEWGEHQPSPPRDDWM